MAEQTEGTSGAPAPSSSIDVAGTAGTAPAGQTSPTETKEAGSATPALELKVPEGWNPPAEHLEKFKAVALEQKLSTEQAQWVLEQMAAGDRAVRDSAEKQLNDWSAELAADKELGQNLEAAKKSALRALEKFGTPKLAQWLEASGLIKHPELFRFVHAVSKAMAEDSIGGAAGSTAPAPNTEEAFHRLLYPNSPSLFAKTG